MRVKTQDKCCIWWCDRPHYAKGYCVTHYRAVERYGSPYGKHDKEFMRINDIIGKACNFANIYLGTHPTDKDTLAIMAKEILNRLGVDYAPRIFPK